ncbi:MAG: ABC transporter ATP-binding protein/permease [Lachnospiraceae bacterium]|nr:ABC transporter ATP-binding protein/permease [Lachnospiraceae bacterium]
MLQLKDIVKIYKTGDTEVEALKGVSITFRNSEFVSILGQSGCGKTTLLNIIGGLDQYTSGDLIINGKSTKKFKDRDWDTYRNHSIGFVFQSYNLIPHQTVLSNVELALTLSGVSKSERRKRAVDVLTKVGLADQIHKKPNQMSGGQMQRVAIARALINDPDILLADEPTGALDSATSVQIMDLLKEISKDRLIIMVTHNPELAEQYSSRIIKLLDGRVIDDSRPYETAEEEVLPAVTKEKGKMKSMSFKTALGLSLNNLMTKKGRTFMTAFAGSIGIIGIALILSLSSGFQAYIDKVQEDTLSNYPITLQDETMDMSAMMGSMSGEFEEEAESYEDDVVRPMVIMTQMYNAMVAEKQANNLGEFRKYLLDEANGFGDLTTAIQFGYDANLRIYGTDVNGKTLQVNPSTVMSTMGMDSMMSMYDTMSSMSPMSAMGGTDMDAFCELLDNQELLESQYDVVAGKWPESKEELIFVISEKNYIMDTALYTLGLKDQGELANFSTATQIEDDGRTFTYDELLNQTYKVVLNTDFYSYNEELGLWEDFSESDTYLEKVLEDAMELKVVGIVRPKPDAVATSITGTVGYTKELTEYIIKETAKQEIVKAQKADTETDVLTGKPFSDSNAAEDAQSNAMDMSTLTPDQQAYLATLTPEELQMLQEQYAAAAVSQATYEGNLALFGVAELDAPSSISIYPIDFASKDLIEEKIQEYNDKVEADGQEANKITYTDYIGIMMSSISTIINVISYVLIAFVSISLVVSSIMIGIITYISVLERTKEIGILRSIGASKKDISRVFNAETMIVGLVSGLLGVGVTVLLCIPINAIIYHFAEIPDVAELPAVGGTILVVISITLTLIAGLIPSRVAAKKDPVEALRTE